MVKIEKHKHLISFLSKYEEEKVKDALDNLLNKQMIGIREYKQILKRIEESKNNSKNEQK